MFKFSIRSFARHSILKPSSVALACVCIAGSLSACSDEDDDVETGTGNLETDLSFFVTSTTHDGNLGGLAGADKICQDLAAAEGAGSKTWRAYLSAANNGTPIHARTRIGSGPWYNASGMMVAADLTALHALTGNADLFITEKGEKVNGQWNSSNGMNGTPVNEHDIMTGSGLDGMLMMTMDAMTGMPAQTTCSDWTSNSLQPGPQVGHTDGMGPMMNQTMPNFTSWSGGHPAAGCSSADLAARGGSGRIYCFAAN
ncbi:MAG TPA: hypothetical protein VJU61_08320 [Polyangiaceae bacterium]|nr:hypothetical protein [Polyangiaceae bacterium]